MTQINLYLMEQSLAAIGATRSITMIVRALADRLGLTDFFPWPTEEAMIDALLDHPATGHATVAALRAQGGIGELRVSHVAHPDLRFPTPSGKVEFYAQRAVELGMPPLPVYEAVPDAIQPLALAQG